MAFAPFPYDIYWGGPFVFGDCLDRRPCLILPSSGNLAVAYISSQIDLLVPWRDFLISAEHENFAATGLRRESYIYGGGFFEAQPRHLIRRCGRLEGALLEEFLEWFG